MSKSHCLVQYFVSFPYENADITNPVLDPAYQMTPENQLKPSVFQTTGTDMNRPKGAVKQYARFYHEKSGQPPKQFSGKSALNFLERTTTRQSGQVCLIFKIGEILIDKPSLPILELTTNQEQSSKP